MALTELSSDVQPSVQYAGVSTSTVLSTQYSVLTDEKFKIENIRYGTYINPSGGTLPSKEGQLPNWSLRLSVEAG